MRGSLRACTLQGGSDVITKTALKRINWSTYKINQSTDRVGVFVSIVSTKIPYKGAGKEYIGMIMLLVACGCSQGKSMLLSCMLAQHDVIPALQAGHRLLARDAAFALLDGGLPVQLTTWTRWFMQSNMPSSNAVYR